VLLSFTVENFRSYREAKTLSLVASKGSELPGNTRSVAGVPLQVLTSAVLYGANGSGKSNLLVAIGYLRSELLRAGINDLGRPTGTFHDRRQRFLLDPEWATRPTRFEIAFLLNGVLHQYDITFHQGAVREERLRVTPNGRVQTWFRRQGQEFDFGSAHLKGPKTRLGQSTQPGLPFLAFAALVEHPQLRPIVDWMRDNLEVWRRVDEGAGWEGRSRETTAEAAEDDAFRRWLEEVLRVADTGVKSIYFEAAPDVPEAHEPGGNGRIGHEVNGGVPQQRVRLIHKGKLASSTPFGLNQESDGTQKLYALLRPVYNALVTGRVAVVDELGAYLHPNLVRELVALFHDEQKNPLGAQLIFTTHDATLLSGELFRRDQVWLTEKDEEGATDLYSLYDFKGVRKDEWLDGAYLRGRYGAIPFIDEELPAPTRGAKPKGGNPTGRVRHAT
jgi:predicted ATPase